MVSMSDGSNSDSTLRLGTYVILAFGVLLSFASAVVPHYTAGHKLLFGLALAGIVPYLVYGALNGILRRWAMLTPGILILAADLLIKIPARFRSGHDYPSDLLYYAPLGVTLVILPVGIAIGTFLDKLAGGQQGGSSSGRSSRRQRDP